MKLMAHKFAIILFIMLVSFVKSSLPPATMTLMVDRTQERASHVSLYERSPDLPFEVENFESLSKNSLQLYIRNLKLSSENGQLKAELTRSRTDIVEMTVELVRLREIEKDFKKLLNDFRNHQDACGTKLLAQLQQQRQINQTLVDEQKKLHIERPSSHPDFSSLIRDNYNLRVQNEELTTHIMQLKRSRPAAYTTENDSQTNLQLQSLDQQVKMLLQYAQNNHETQQFYLHELESIRTGGIDAYRHRGGQDSTEKDKERAVHFDRDTYLKNYFANQNPVFNWHQSLKYIDPQNPMKVSIKLKSPTLQEDQSIISENQKSTQHFAQNLSECQTKPSKSIITLQKAQGIYTTKKLRIKSQFAFISPERKLFVNKLDDKGNSPLIFASQPQETNNHRIQRRNVMSAKQLRK